MALNRLVIEPESHMLSDVSVVTNVTTPIVVPESDEQPVFDPINQEDLGIGALAGFGFYRDKVNPLEEAYERLGEIRERLALEGLIDRTTAQEIDSYIPDFYDSNGAGNTFTYTPSIEGLAVACEAIDSTILSSVAAGFKKMGEWAVSVYNKFAEWVNKFIERMKNSGNASNTNLMSDLNEKNRALFDSSESVFKLLDEMVSSPEKVSALLFSKIDINADSSAEDTASVDRAKELFEQSMGSIRAKVEGFKKALGASSYGKEMFGAIDTSNRPDVDSVRAAATAASSLEKALDGLYRARNKDSLVMSMQALGQAMESVQASTVDHTNTGDGEDSASDMAKRSLQEIYTAGKAFIAKEQNTADVSSLKEIMSTVEAVKVATMNISEGVSKFGDYIVSIQDIDEATISEAKTQVTKAINMNMSLVNALTKHIGVVTAATQGKVMFITEAVKLVNSVKPVISRVIAPLSAETKKTVIDNLKGHYRVDFGTNTET